MKANGISIKEAILKQRYEALKPIKLPKQTLYKERHKIKKLKQAASENITNLPVLSYKKTFTSMAIKSILSQSVI
jgi:ACT domain-containing protein